MDFDQYNPDGLGAILPFIRKAIPIKYTDNGINLKVTEFLNYYYKSDIGEFKDGEYDIEPIYPHIITSDTPALLIEYITNLLLFTEFTLIGKPDVMDNTITIVPSEPIQLPSFMRPPVINGETYIPNFIQIKFVGEKHRKDSNVSTNADMKLSVHIKNVEEFKDVRTFDEISVFKEYNKKDGTNVEEMFRQMAMELINSLKVFGDDSNSIIETHNVGAQYDTEEEKLEYITKIYNKRVINRLDDPEVKNTDNFNVDLTNTRNNNIIKFRVTKDPFENQVISVSVEDRVTTQVLYSSLMYKLPKIGESEYELDKETTSKILKDLTKYI